MLTRQGHANAPGEFPQPLAGQPSPRSGIRALDLSGVCEQEVIPAAASLNGQNSSADSAGSVKGQAALKRSL